MECYRRRGYRRLDSLVTNDDEDGNQKIAVALGQSDVKYKDARKARKLHRKIMLSIMLLRRYRDAYVRVMHSLAEHVVQLNNGNSYLFKQQLPNNAP